MKWLFILALIVIYALIMVSSIPGIRRSWFTEIDNDDYHNQSTQLSMREFPEQWFSNLVDHFDPINTSRYQQRFFINDEFYNKDKPYTPILITLGCEGPISTKWVNPDNGPLVTEFARKSGGLLIVLEHRYYGTSQPFPDHEVKHLQQLTMEQALADAAKFIKEYVIPNWAPRQDHPVVVFGGSYGGTLVTAMRQSYNNLVYHAVASSGVYQARYDLTDFLEAVIESYEFYGGSKCVDSISTATGWLTARLNSNQDSDLDYVNSKLPICTKFNKNDSKLDRQGFWSLFTDSFIQIVQYNKENGPGYTISKMCDELNAAPTPQDKFDVLASIHTNHVIPGSCYRWKFQEQVDDIGTIALDPTGAKNMRQWWWQCTTAFGWLQPLTEKTQKVFGGQYDFEFFQTLLSTVFGQQFDKAFIEDRIKSQHAKYNEYHIQTSNVIFTSGAIDPWRQLAVQRNNRELHLTSYHVNRTSHCATLYAPQSYDPPTLQSAREAMWDDFVQAMDRFPATLTNWR